MNEEEIAGVPDALPTSVKNRLKKSGKQPLSEALKDVPPIDPTYQPIDIPERASTVSLPADLDTNPLSLFHIFLLMSNYNLISTHPNINAEMKRSVVDNQDDSQEENNISQRYSDDKVDDISGKKGKQLCAWGNTTGEEIAAFIGVFLLQGEAKLGSTNNY